MLGGKAANSAPLRLRHAAKSAGLPGSAGQTSTELIIIVAVVLLLVVVVSADVMQKNSFTTTITAISENTQECSRIAAIISNFQANPGYSETKITPRYYGRVEKNNIRISPCPNCGECICNTCKE